MKQDYYRVLGLTHAATAADIKAAYKKLALQFHPDRNPHDAFAEERFKQINEAYQVLSDNRKKATYDWLLQYQHNQRQQSEHARSFSPPPVSTYAPLKQPLPWKLIKKVSLTILIAILLCSVGYNLWINQVIARSYEHAQVAERQQKWSLAEEHYTRILAYEKEAEVAIARRAQIRYQYLKDYQGAVLDFSTLLHLSENPSYNLYMKRAQCWLALKKFSAALLDLNKVIELKPSLQSAYLDRAIAYLRMEDNWPQAVSDLTHFIERSGSTEQQDALLYRSFAFYRIGEYEAAWQDAERVLATNTKSAQAYYLQAKVKQARQDAATSCALLAKAAELGFTVAQAEQERLCL